MFNGVIVSVKRPSERHWQRLDNVFRSFSHPCYDEKQRLHPGAIECDAPVKFPRGLFDLSIAWPNLAMRVTVKICAREKDRWLGRERFTYRFNVYSTPQFTPPS
jgi:hypothetical protein